MKNILITGGAGFIGSHVVKRFVNNYPNYNIYNIDNLTYAGNLNNLEDVKAKKNYFFFKVDINNHKEILKLFNDKNITDVIHLAAESHVDKSIENSFEFAKTNVLGTLSLLEAAKISWNLSSNNNIFYHISTDEVYGALGLDGSFTEISKYNPNSPYSASKASADMLVRSYSKTYGLDTTISISSNNYGPNQNIEKLIPQIIYCLKNDKKVSIYGNGLNVRNWLHVIDNVIGIDLIFNKSESGESYNIGSSDELTNMMVYKIIYSQIFNDDNYHKKINFTENRPGHDYRYSLDCDKIKKHLSWKPQFNFKDEIKNIINKY